jgi:hypothetical protein
VLDQERIAAYAGATGDPTRAVQAGETVPAVFPIILAFEAQEAARADLPDGIWERVRGGVHGEHDIVMHRPLHPGETLDTWAQLLPTTPRGATPRYPETGRPTTSTSTSHGPPDSTSCSRTGCAPWRCVLTGCSTSSGSAILLACAGSRFGSRRRPALAVT